MDPHKLILLCDGTWCGREANTKTNIYLLAEIMGCNMESDLTTWNTEHVRGRYAQGVGLGSTFLDYIIDGTTGLRIDEECKDAYRFIVENYTPGDEIWMFGLSRGAYTVRSVAGMINNCGIITPSYDAATSRIDDARTDLRCATVYEIYRSQDDWAHPQSDEMREYRGRNSHNIKTPVKFMGLFDTVGSGGIPKLHPREGFVWPESFYDTKISSVVGKVYHAISMHDRLTAFTPTLAYRDSKHGDAFPIYEKWFPGTHYDICRQEFRFFRLGVTAFEELFSWPLDAFSKPVKPNHVLSDLTLRWMLESIGLEDPDLIPDVGTRIDDINTRLRQNDQNVGSGDVYDDLLKYLPFGNVIQRIYRLADIMPFVREARSGRVKNISYEYVLKLLPFFPTIFQLIFWLVDTWSSFWRGSGETLEGAWEGVLGVSAIKQGLLALNDRRITNLEADFYHYEKPDASLCLRIEDVAALDGSRYPSKTYQKFLLFHQDMDALHSSGPPEAHP